MSLTFHDGDVEYSSHYPTLPSLSVVPNTGISPRPNPLGRGFFWRKTNRFSDYVFADKPLAGFGEILCENHLVA